MNEHDEAIIQYPKLSKRAINLIDICINNGVYQSDRGRELLQQIEMFLNGHKVINEQLAINIENWYNGTFCAGYYMNDNDSEFAKYLKSLISVKLFN